MRTITIISIFVIGFILPTFSFAQNMMGFPSSSPDNTAIQSQQQEEQEGKNLLDELTSKTITCSQLKDADFDKIGEYFMGQSIGDTSRHIAMNEMMKRMVGEQGEEQAHIVMGKRLSGCDTSAAFPSQDAGFMPMMGMMTGGWSYPSGYHQPNNFNSMMGNFFGNSMMGYSGWFGWIFMILLWVLIITGIVVLIKWLFSQSQGSHKQDKSPLEILKERYARGEIDKKEFEGRKKAIS